MRDPQFTALMTILTVKSATAGDSGASGAASAEAPLNWGAEGEEGPLLATGAAPKAKFLWESSHFRSGCMSVIHSS